MSRRISFSQDGCTLAGDGIMVRCEATEEDMKMIRIVLDQEQAEVVTRSQETVEVCDSDGKVLGVINRAVLPFGFTEADIAEAKRRLAEPGPRYTTDQVLEHLRSLENR